MERIGQTYPDLLLVWCGGMDSSLETRKSYILIEEYCPTVCAIYPHRRIFNLRDMVFAETCYDTVHRDAARRDKYLSILDPIRGAKDEADMLETLLAYLIDSDKSTAEAAELLHVHESTVKYRLNKINRRLGYDITQMPATYNLYLALTMKWLLDYQSGPALV